MDDNKEIYTNNEKRLRQSDTFNHVFGKKFISKKKSNTYEKMGKDEQIINAVKLNDIYLLNTFLQVYPSTVWHQLKDTDGRDLLTIAVQSGHLNMVKFLLKDGAKHFSCGSSEDGNTV